MYMLKRIVVNNMEQILKVEDGLLVTNWKDPKGHAIASDSFWGTLLLNSGSYPKTEKERKEISVCYANSYMISDKHDGFINLCLFRDGDKFTKEDNKDVSDKDIYGYIIFITNSCDPIESNGDILFRRYANHMVVVLNENGHYVELDGFHIEYNDGKLSARYYI